MPPMRKVIGADGTEILPPAWDSHRLAVFSIFASAIFAFICLTHCTQLTNGMFVCVVGMLVLKEAGKKRQEENQVNYKNRAGEGNPFDSMQSNGDLRIAQTLMLVSTAIFFCTFHFTFFKNINLWPIGVMLIIAMFLRFSFAFGNSMLPSIGYGDLLFVECLLFFRRPINRGDVIGFPKPPGLEIDFAQSFIKKRGLLGPILLKRVIALPDELVRITEGQVFINDKPLIEGTYSAGCATYEIKVLNDLGKGAFRPFSKSVDANNPIMVPKDHYFVLGDFRISENVDSHVFGFVPVNEIQYRLLATIPVSLFGLAIARQNIFNVTRHLQVAKGLIREGKLEKAIDECNAAITIYDKCAPAFAFRAQAKSKLKRYQEAVDDSSLAIRLYKTTKDPAPGLWENAVFPHSIRSIAYTRLKKLDNALLDCNQVISSNKNNSNAYANRADLYREMGKFNEALNDCNRAISIGPATSSVYRLKTQINVSLKHWDQALIDCERAVTLDANNGKAYTLMALIALEKKQFEKVVDWCNKAENVDKNQIEIYYLRAAVDMALSQYEKAYEECNRAKELGLFNDQFCIILGTACVFLKKWTEALDNLKEARNLTSTSAAVVSNCALARFELGCYEESLADCEAAINMDPSLSPAYKNRARIRLKQNKNQDAIADLNKAIGLDPVRGDFYYYRSQAYAALGDSVSADSDLAKSKELGCVKEPDIVS